MQLSVWLIRDCIPNWLNNTFFLKAALREDNHLEQGIYWLFHQLHVLYCSYLKSNRQRGIKGPWWIQTTPLLLTVVEKHFVQQPNQCVHQNLEVDHLQVLMWELDCLQALLYLCVPCSSGSVYSRHSWKNRVLPFWASSESLIHKDTCIQISSAVAKWVLAPLVLFKPAF